MIDGLAQTADEHVVWLQVVVHDAVVVQRGQALAELDTETDESLQRELVVACRLVLGHPHVEGSVIGEIHHEPGTNSLGVDVASRMTRSCDMR